MKKLVTILSVIILMIPLFACSPSAAKTEPPIPQEIETDQQDSQETAVSDDEVVEPSAAAPVTLSSGQQPGWYAYTDANDVRDLVVHDGVVYAATLGGMVAWRLDSGYAMQYTPMDGMEHVSANAIVYCEIPEPRILVGTLTGISEYDPSTGLWQHDLEFPEESSIDSSKINRLYCDQANNRLLIGYYGLGVLDLASGDFLRYTEADGLLWDSVSDIAVYGKDIWIANGYKGVSRISNGQITNFSEEQGMPDNYANSLAFDQAGTLWVGSSGGLISYKSGQWKMYASDSPANLSSVYNLEITPDGKIWAATLPFGTGRLCQFNPGDATCAEDFLDVDGQGINALVLTADGIPVYGTNKGISLYENGAAISLKTEDQLASNFVDSLASTPDGKLWVGTDSGIQLIDLTNPTGEWATFTDNEFPEMGGNWGKAVAIGSDGTVWVAMTNGSASRYQNGTWTNFEDIYSFDTVAVDADGRAWFGDDSKGIIVLNADGSQAFTLTTSDGLPGDNVQAILTDLSGRIWIGTDKGLAKYENGTLETVFGPDSQELPGTYIRDLALHPDGALIIGCFIGLARYDGNQVTTMLDFLKDGYSDARLTTLAVAPDGQVWVGTDKGVLTQENGAWKMLTTRDGLLTNYISALHVDPLGAVWIGGGGSNFDGGGMIQIVP